MKRVYLLVSLFIILILTACGGAAQPETEVESETERETETEVENETETEATPTAPKTTDGESSPEAPETTAEPDAYPGAAASDNEAPAATKAPEGYPDSAVQNQPPSGYPAEEASMVWVIRALGEQCEAPDTYQYADLEAAVSALEAAGVTVSASDSVTRAECEACDCPTSEHFRAQIRAQDLVKAQELGWSEDTEES